MSAGDDIVAGRYRLLERIGTGGMGFVWRAVDERLGREVAVKQLRLPWGSGEAESAVWHERAMREARITARLHHPHAVAVFDVVDNRDAPCLIMEYFPSRSLHEVLHEQRTVPTAVVGRLGSEVASALAAAHAVGIVHRDVKPGNVLIASDGTAKISDFGIAHALGDVSLTSTGMVTGTPAYLAPEVARGADSTPASDVFSLGATLYAALEGAPPFGTHENPMALLHRVASGTITPPADGGPLTPLLLRMLAPEPGDRPPMDEVARLLRDAPAGSAEELGTTLVLPEAPTPGTDPSEDGAAPTAAPTAAIPIGATAAAVGGARVSTPPPHEALAADLLEPAGPRPGEAGTEPPDRPRRRTALVGLALLVALAVLVIAVRSLQGDAPTPARAQGSTSAGTSPSATPTPSTSPPTGRPSTSTPPRPSPSASAPSSGAGAPTSAQLARAVEDYYAVLPDNLDAGWARLTERYQRTTAKSRETYAAFWGSIDRVDVSDAAGSPPGSATATITYHFSDGRVFVERTSYGLVEQDGILKIDRSKVLSSQRL